MRLGYHCASFHFPESEWSAFDAAMALARRLEDAGFDWFSTMDHLWQLPFVGQRDEPYFDAYTTLPAIAWETEQMELGALVTSPHYRNPAILGRQLTDPRWFQSTSLLPRSFHLLPRHHVSDERVEHPG